ncbi:dihydrolipoamide acetyltransferase family protein [Zobellia galactanivorans]|uniref:dihydrolipoamide acetyltransferase family protein n=1 Tax=Zobellia TaxID=112040 RepID=UPI0026E4032D|nr:MULTISPECIES: dihydrolipoamide acetyltransferase family protein [Zobellia]MDO6518844.1 dihydrolipoamide acetyltransferase family protein [Zobellia uliginosa]MDO6810155.1 dihydrolipoamide acetyltransferase family protein [Zobellia galactanivorans]
MSKFELKLPRMGESVAEATLTSWLKEVGDTIELDEPIFEIATDKVDSEVPSEVEGVLVERFFEVDDVIKVGETVAIIETEQSANTEAVVVDKTSDKVEESAAMVEETVKVAKEVASAPVHQAPKAVSGERFYSPLVKNIAKQEGISMDELDTIKGTGNDGRVTKNDILDYLKNGRVRAEEPAAAVATEVKKEVPSVNSVQAVKEPVAAATIKQSVDAEVIPMSRMGKLIAKHMAESVSTSAHVQSFIEVDVTNIVNWRNKVKADFEKREGEKLTFTPIFMEAVAKALKKYPMMNISVDGDTVIKKKNINIGMAAALPDGNLIVPVIKNADQLNLVGMAKVVNDLAFRSKTNKLKPDEVQDGTYTVTNVGTFGSVFGTPIINQPQVGILALGAIRKIPSVIETAEGDFIGIRSKMYLSHSYDHRVVNGALGSMFAKAVADYLEAWDVDREI